MEYSKRKQVHLPDYDYSAPGVSFVTVCTQDRRGILSDSIVGAGVLDGPLYRPSPASLHPASLPHSSSSLKRRAV